MIIILVLGKKVIEINLLLWTTFLVLLIISFLTTARKFNYNYVYIFHVIYPEKFIWRCIVSQTNIFNIFTASVSLNSVWRIYKSVWIRKTNNCILQSMLWISRLFIELVNKNERVWKNKKLFSPCNFYKRLN